MESLDYLVDKIMKNLDGLKEQVTGIQELEASIQELEASIQELVKGVVKTVRDLWKEREEEWKEREEEKIIEKHAKALTEEEFEIVKKYMEKGRKEEEYSKIITKKLIELLRDIQKIDRDKAATMATYYSKKLIEKINLSVLVTNKYKTRDVKETKAYE